MRLKLQKWNEITRMFPSHFFYLLAFIKTATLINSSQFQDQTDGGDLINFLFYYLETLMSPFPLLTFQLAPRTYPCMILWCSRYLRRIRSWEHKWSFTYDDDGVLGSFHTCPVYMPLHTLRWLHSSIQPILFGPIRSYSGVSVSCEHHRWPVFSLQLGCLEIVQGKIVVCLHPSV